MSYRNRTCAKCRGWTTHRYNRGHARDLGRKDEHLDYRCGSCGFEWEEDCMDAKEGPLPTCPDCGVIRNQLHRDGCLHEKETERLTEAARSAGVRVE